MHRTYGGLSVGVLVDDLGQGIVFLAIFPDDLRLLQILFTLLDLHHCVLQIVVNPGG